MIKTSLACGALISIAALAPGAALADTMNKDGYTKRPHTAAPYYRNAYRMAYRPRMARYYGPRNDFRYHRPWRAGVAVAATTAPYYASGYAAPSYGYGYAAAPAYASAPVSYGYQTVTVETHAVQQYTQPYVSAPAYYAAPAYYSAPAYYNASSCCSAGFPLPFFGYRGCGC